MRPAAFRSFVAKTIDIALDVFDPFLLVRKHCLLLRQLFGTLLLELTVIAGEETNLFMFNVRDTGTNLIEKIPIM